MFHAALQRIMEALKLNKRDYNTHSFRIGAATSASLANISDTHIQMLGHWRSSAFQRYIRPPASQALPSHWQQGTCDTHIFVGHTNSPPYTQAVHNFQHTNVYSVFSSVCKSPPFT